MTWTSRTIRDGASRVDFGRRIVVFRKARVLRADEDLTAEYAYAHAKCDGLRLIVAREASDDESVLALTTRPTDLRAQYPNHPIWRRDFVKRLPLWNWLDGELCVPGHGREAVKTALVNDDERLNFCAFGASRFMLEAYDDMATANEALASFGCETLPLIPVNNPKRYPGLMNVAGYDGVVYKTTMYGGWAKLKNKKTIDVVVTGLKPGCGKYFGQVGSLTCSVYLGDYGNAGAIREICSCQGMDDCVRASISSADVGRVCELAYERVGSRGRLQHPRFLRWRDDKKPHECTADQDEKLCVSS